jgi:RHS repeat-associated protein
MKNWFAAACALLPLQFAAAQDVTVYALQGQITRGSQNITTLGADLMGDKVNLYNGALEFNQTDVSLPGNNALPVAVARRHVAGRDRMIQGEFGDWDLDVPQMHGVFAAATGWVGSTGTTARCTNYGPPPTYVASATAFWYAEEFWQSNFMSIPGFGNQEILRRSAANTLAPSDGQSYPLVTRDHWQIRCLPSLINGAGEGFIALSPEGTQYRFDWLATRSQPTLRFSTGAPLARAEVRLRATLVTDRFGNTVSYTDDAANPARLTRIQSSDGRTINLTYTVVNGKSRVQTVWDGTRTWTYSYAAGGDLIRVTLPDNSAWQFSLGGLVYPYPMHLGEGAECDFPGGWPSGTLSGSITHPSGATGSFATRYATHGRAAVSRLCVQKVSQGPTYDRWPKSTVSQTLVSKTLIGPGMASMSWAYNYPYQSGSWAPCASCTDTKAVTVTDPRGVVTRYVYGTRFQVSEGQLLRVDVDWNASAGTALRTTVNRYRQPAGQAYPEPVGISPSEVGDYLAARHRPVDQRVITQQVVNFTWEAAAGTSGFDAYAMPLAVTKYSTLGYTRTDTTTYEHHTGKWVLGRVATVTGGSAPMESYSFDPVTLKRTGSYAFGRLLHTDAWNANGTLYSRSDPAGRATVYGNYHRGLARNIAYPDGTSESAVVNNVGLITSHTGQAGHTTGYGYDAMGRLASITPPAGDPVTYHPTTLNFVQVNALERGIGAGHWKQTIVTGNARTERYFDGLWRERLTRTYDVGNEPGTRRVVERRFDADNRTVFESYPQREIDAVNIVASGVTRVYDGLGRISQHSQTSELGPLNTNTSYLSGFQRQTINPRGFATTTAFQAFDTPSEDSITAIAAPEGVNVSISRDVFGKATAITRSGSYAGVPISVTRSYVYDSFHRLCKTIEPESGATAQDYDVAGNLAWRASGLGLPSTSSCDQASVPAGAKATHTYDTMNRLWTTSFGDGSPGITRTYKPDGLLATISSAGSIWTYEYNALRSLWWEQLNFAGGEYRFERTFEQHGKVASLSYPGMVVDYAPNALGEPTRVGNFATGVTYHPNGGLDGFTYGNNVVHSQTQNARGLPAQWRDTGVMHDLYTYDANGNVASITDQQEQGATTRTMGYDGLDRLTSAYAPGVWGSASYGYDPIDNLRSSIVGSRNSTHHFDDGTNRLTRLVNGSGTTNYGYDVQGNIVARGAQGFSFDRGNRMLSAAGKASYTYDGHGRRVYVNFADGTGRLHAYSQSGQVLYGIHSTQGSTRYVYLGRRLIAEVTNGVAQYAHADALGSPVAKTATSGAVLGRTRYEPYGATAAGANPTGIGFTGHVNDTDTGLVYMQQRYYDPLASHFVSIDPVATNPASGKLFNRYEYAYSNPYAFIDPTGRTGSRLYSCGGGATMCHTSNDSPENDPQGLSNTSADRIVGRSLKFAVNMLVPGLDCVGGDSGCWALAATTVVAGPVLKVAATGVRLAAGGVRAGEAGAFASLRGVKGDGLTAHHMPQAAAGRLGYNEGGALVMTQAEHAATRTYGARGATTLQSDAGLSFREVLSKDIRDVRSIVGPKYNEGLSDLIDYYRQNFPELMRK